MYNYFIMIYSVFSFLYIQVIKTKNIQSQDFEAFHFELICKEKKSLQRLKTGTCEYSSDY